MRTGELNPILLLAAPTRHPISFHHKSQTGLDLCTSRSGRVSRGRQFLLNFLRIWLDCQAKGWIAGFCGGEWRVRQGVVG
jgi:hypothetical protein